MIWCSFLLCPPQRPLEALVCTDIDEKIVARWNGSSWISPFSLEALTEKVRAWISLESIPTPDEVDRSEKAATRRINDLEHQIERLENYDPCEDCSASKYLQTDHCSVCFERVANRALMKVRSGNWLCPDCAIKAIEEKGISL